LGLRIKQDLENLCRTISTDMGESQLAISLRTTTLLLRNVGNLVERSLPKSQYVRPRIWPLWEGCIDIENAC
jgi:hypothetical protein